MPAKFVSNKDETIRLFKNPVLEYFSHIHPATPIVVFTPVVIYMLYIASQSLVASEIVSYFLLGVVIWTLTEYVIHRWAFHYEPHSQWAKNLHFLVHGIHHDYPRDSTRLVMPVPVSVPLAILFYYLFRLAFGVYTPPLFAGFMTGYVVYDSIHYATHHWPMRSGVGKWLKDYHIRHHFEDDHTAYGVSNPFWDFVFRTVPDYLREKQVKKGY
ncbi:MAG: sterol desaturase family protein [Bacteroidetes bacterium]|nr:sterol desaturase family protein [Bacteroidota bacterium]